MSGHLWLVVHRRAAGRDERELIPLAGGCEGVEVQIGAAIHGGVGDLDDSGEPDDPFFVQFIAAEHLGVVAEIAQEPGELPQRPVGAVEAPGQVYSKRAKPGWINTYTQAGIVYN